MNEEHDKQIAKIQHFYDIMNKQLADISGELILVPEDIYNIGRKDVLNNLVEDYQKIFHNFLYHE